MSHWRNELAPSNYLGAWDFTKGEKKIVTIVSIKKEKIAELQGAEKAVLKTSETKPIMLNATNLKNIQKALDSEDPKDWVGKKITLTTESVRSVQDKGEFVDAIRVVRERPQTKKSTLTDDRFKKALKAISDNEFTKEDLIAKYELTKEQLDEIQG
jgi:hypothetical protein